MPVARGIMQIARSNVYQTVSSISSIIPTQLDVQCGDTIRIIVSVTNPHPGLVVNGGTFDVIELNHDVIIGSGNISAGAGITHPISDLFGNLNLVVRYNGLLNTFAGSSSSPITYSIPSVQTQTKIISPIRESYYCYSQPLEVIAKVTSRTGDIPFGTVSFTLLQSSGSINIGESTLNGGGYATITIPANTGNNEISRLYASYLGQACFLASNSSTASTIIPVSNDPTTISVDTVTPHPFYTNMDIVVRATVSATHLTGPSDGMVRFYATKGATEVIIGDVPPTDGVADATISAGTLTAGDWIIRAIYAANHSTGCYQSSPDPAGHGISVLEPLH